MVERRGLEMARVVPRQVGFGGMDGTTTRSFSQSASTEPRLGKRRLTGWPVNRSMRQDSRSGSAHVPI
jgi:hypothetical protein